MSKEKPTTAFVLSLIAGALILIGGGMGSFFLGMMGGSSGMMGGRMMGFPGWEFGIGLSVLGLIVGLIVIFGAIMLDSKPNEHRTWGAIILIFSILSILIGMGGFGLGAILGIIGGALAISWTPTKRARK